MKRPDKDTILKLRQKLAEHAQAKKEYVAHFKKGGTLADFEPKHKHVSRPI